MSKGKQCKVNLILKEQDSNRMLKVEDELWENESTHGEKQDIVLSDSGDVARG